MNSCDSWLCTVDPPRSGTENMRIDLALLNNLEKCSERMTFLRFYDWETPTVSLGKHQKADGAVDCSYCRQSAIPVVHRPTGGRAVLHDCELTYAVVSNDPKCFPLSSIRETYRLIAMSLQEGMGGLGIVTQLAGSSRKNRSLSGQQLEDPCFVSPSYCELLYEERKIVGSAQRRLRRSFLQHGSIPLQVNHATMAASLGVSEELLRRSVVSLSEALGRVVARRTLCEALQAGFEQVCRVKLHRREVDEDVRCHSSAKIASN